jgi:hypothetical protein
MLMESSVRFSLLASQLKSRKKEGKNKLFIKNQNRILELGIVNLDGTAKNHVLLHISLK